MQMQAAIYFFSPSCNKYFKNIYAWVNQLDQNFIS